MPPPLDRSTGPSLRLATFNLLHGRSLTDGQVRPERLRDGVRSLEPDVIGLQEVDRDQPRSHGLDLTREVAGALGATSWRFVPALLGTPGERWEAAGEPELPGPAYGVGLVSRLPVLSWHVLRLPAARVRSPVLLPGGGRRVIWLRDEPRVGVAAVVQGPDGPRTVATTHLSFVPGWNGVQLRRLTAFLAGLPGPRVLLGDLNMPPPLPRLLTGWHPLARVPTYPGPQPRLQLDHVLASEPLVVRAVATPDLPLSDHRALVVEL